MTSESEASSTALDPPAASAPVGVSLPLGYTNQALVPGSEGGPNAMFAVFASATASKDGPGTKAIAEHASLPFGLNVDVTVAVAASNTTTPSAVPRYTVAPSAETAAPPVAGGAPVT